MILPVAFKRPRNFKVKEPRRSFNSDELRTNCIQLMRKIAQPVSVATTIVPSISGAASHIEYHGATLSSLASVAMYPYPVVSFALRTPSRMADIFRLHASEVQSKGLQPLPHVVINLLSSSMENVALQFSRPRTEPFCSNVYFLNEDKIPVLYGSLGALSCAVIQAISLKEDVSDCKIGSFEQGSKLFLARVLRVEAGCPPDVAFIQNKLPLVYHQQQYTTVRQISEHRDDVKSAS